MIINSCSKIIAHYCKQSTANNCPKLYILTHYYSQKNLDAKVTQYRKNKVKYISIKDVQNRRFF